MLHVSHEIVAQTFCLQHTASFCFSCVLAGLSKNLSDYVVSVIAPSAFMLLEVLG